MPSSIFYPAVGADDGWVSSADLYPSETYMVLGYDCRLYVRFVNVTIPQGSSITAAFVRFTANDERTNATVNTNIYFNDIDDAVAPTNKAEADGLVTTTEFTAWDAIASWSDGTTYDTPSLVDEVQEIIDRVGFASGNALMVLVDDDSSTAAAVRVPSPIEHAAGAEIAALHITWELEGVLAEGVTLSESMEDNFVGLAETVTVADTNAIAMDVAPLAESVTIDDANVVAMDVAPLTETVTIAEGMVVLMDVTPLSESVTIADEIDAWYAQTIAQIGMIYDRIIVGWVKEATSTAAIVDTVIGDVSKTIRETLGVRETITNNWNGTETIQTTLKIFGNALVAQLFNEEVTSTAAAVDTIAYMHRMISAITEALGAADTVTPLTTFNPVITEAVAITGLITALRTLNNTVSESAAIVDALGVTWPKIISDGAAVVDTAAFQWMGMHIITESLVATETAIGLFNISEAIAETLGAAATVVLKQALQASVTEILNFGITLLLDGEVWECWVLSSNKFNVSVYSGFEFNSYATYNGVSYGCKSDGIFKLSGTTDDGTAFNSGIILPETDFGSGKQKRFRKAFFGISGTSPSIKVETESGNVTYNIVSSKANLQRVQKGVDWSLKIQGFDELSWVELVPVILTRG